MATPKEFPRANWDPDLRAELYKQESDVEVTHPDFPDDPTVDDPFFTEVEGVEPPGYASPFS